MWYSDLSGHPANLLRKRYVYKHCKAWLADVANTANEKNYTQHMGLISKRVSLQGVPGFDNIDYDAWAAQCKHEFENNLIRSVRYDGFKLRTETENNIMFKTFETVYGTDGTSNAQGVEMLIEKEEDGQWCLKQERVLPDDESIHDGLLERKK